MNNIPADLAPPTVVRQVAGPHPQVPPELNPTIIPGPGEENDPLLQTHGQFDFSPMPNGLNGYTEDDYDNILRNNGWWIPEGPYEEEDFPDDTDEDSDEEEEEEEDDREMINEVVNNF